MQRGCVALAVFLALAAGLLLAGCSDNRPGTDEVAQTVKQSMQDYLDRTDNFKQYHAHVTDVTLVRRPTTPTTA